MKQSPLERAQADLAHWQAELAQVERERKGMVWVLRVGVPLGALVAVALSVDFHWWIGLGIAAMSVVTWAMGVYMTTVRRAEFAQQVRQAESALAAARAVS